MHPMCVQAAPGSIWPSLIRQVYSELAIDKFHLQPTVLAQLQLLGIPETPQCEPWLRKQTDISCKIMNNMNDIIYKQ